MSKATSTPDVKAAPLDRPIKITFFQTVKSNTGHLRETTWPKLVALLQNGRTAPKRKDQLPLWCPATFEDNERKGQKAQAISLFAIDVDNEVKPTQLEKLTDPPTTVKLEKDGKITYKIEPPNTVEQVLAALPGTACVWHTSFSHRLAWPKFRFAWPLCRDVTPDEYAKLWTNLERRFMAAGVYLDPATKNVSRVWYVPAKTEHFDSGHETGGVIDVDAVLSEEPDDTTIDTEGLEARIARLPTDISLTKLEALVDPILDQVARCTPLVQESLVQVLAAHPKLRLGVLRKLLAKKGADVETDSSGILQQILDGLRYVRSPTGRVYARWGAELLPTDGAKSVEKVARAFRELSDRFVSKDAIGTAMLAIRGQQMDVAEVPIRFARYDGHIYVDLGDETGRCIEITRDEVRVRPESPIGFYRPATMRPLPAPIIPRCHEQAAADLELLRELLGVEGENWHACLAWLLSAMGVTGTYTILIVKGQKGSGKSTRARLLRRTIDPRRPELTGLPATEENLAIQAQNAQVLNYDNLRHLPPNISDALCRLATLDGLEKRTLYSDQDLTVLEAARPIIINGIADVATEPDLLDRSLIVRFERVATPKTEDEVAAEHEAMHAQVLGALCLLCSFALRHETGTEVPTDIRMRGPARFAAAAEIYAGLEEGHVAAAYLSTRSQATAAAADDDFVAGFLEWYPDGGDTWSGTATALLKALVTHAVGENEKARRPDWLPKGARGLRAKLDKFASTLLDLGVTLRFEAGGRGDQKRNIITVGGVGSKDTPPDAPRSSPGNLADGARGVRGAGSSDSDLGVDEEDEDAAQATLFFLDPKRSEATHPMHPTRPSGENHAGPSGVRSIGNTPHAPQLLDSDAEQPDPDAADEIYWELMHEA